MICGQDETASCGICGLGEEACSEVVTREIFCQVAGAPLLLVTSGLDCTGDEFLKCGCTI